MIVDESCRIVSHTDAGPGYRFLVLDAPRMTKDLVPGQFVHVRVPALEATALRRPFSVFDAADGRVTLLYKQVGRGTAALATVKPGDVISVLGPLGHGFPETCNGTPLLVGGGYGVAPLYFLARRLGGHKGILFVGGRTKTDLLAVDRFKALGWEVRTATVDGSDGFKGFVTGPLDKVLAALQTKGAKFELFTCGPDGLLKAVTDRAVAAGCPGWISMDRHMVCGVGACFACIQPVRKPDGSVYNARCCVNGPVFKATELVWEKQKVKSKKE